MKVVLPGFALVAGLIVMGLVGGCIGDSPEDQQAAALGNQRDGDPEHRPGQPCLACHSTEYSPGGGAFVLAGTIYMRAGDPDSAGVEGAEVIMKDKAGHQFTALTNRTGNFMVTVDSALDAPSQRARGRLRIPWQPVFPVEVSVGIDGVEKDMETLIWREGSCAGCHVGSQTGTDHVERVWFTDAP
ncbi:MAG: hypothetical protein IT370_05075 [Deltaproteobacteria bacterium]|nr:hypothetical protein [Deltaproteobacteria bacterium]